MERTAETRSGTSSAGGSARVVDVSDDGHLVMEQPDGRRETRTIPLERVPEYRRLLGRPAVGWLEEQEGSR